jgi:hypothetical protein
MTILTTTARLTCAIAAIAICTAPASAQSRASERPDGGRKSGTYLKTGLAHWQGDIFSEGSLTQWNVDLFGAKYNLTSVKVEVERYFGRSFLVSGFSIGYRKDTLRYVESGHMINAMLFHDVDLKVIALKAGGGVEWGVPSLNFDTTEFDQAGDGTLRYRHTYPRRNASVPLVGTKEDGALYPFASFSVLQRPGGLLFEAGVRVNIMRFHFDDFEVAANGESRSAFDESRVLVPYLFVNLGFRMF